jgi:hypothetical protein
MLASEPGAGRSGTCSDLEECKRNQVKDSSNPEIYLEK